MALPDGHRLRPGISHLIASQLWHHDVDVVRSITENRWVSQLMCSFLLAILRVIVESGTLHSIMSVFLLGFSSESTDAYFASVLGQISVTARRVLHQAPWPKRSL